MAKKQASTDEPQFSFEESLEQLEQAVRQREQVHGLQEELSLGGLEVESHGQRVEAPDLLQGQFQEFVDLAFDAFGRCIEMNSLHQSTPVGTWPESGAIEGEHLDARLAEGLARILFQDPDRLLALNEEMPSSASEGFGAHHFSEAAHFKDRGLFPKRAGVGVLAHERDHQMVVGVQNLHCHLLVSGFEDVNGQEGLREEHNLGQGEEGENGW